MNNKSWLNTPFTKLTGTRIPIVQGPFGGGFSSVALTATVSNLGGLGSFGAQPYVAAEIVEYCRLIREKTQAPFNINLWVDNRDERLKSFSGKDYEKLKRLFQPYFDDLGVPMPDMPKDLGPTFEDQVQGVIDAKPAVFSFVYGIPSEDVLEQCRKNGIITLGNATTVDEAVALESAGVDAVVATGFEAGGHRVSFLKSSEESLTGTFSLVPQIADAVNIPVVAAGGIADARGIKAAFTLGAHAVQMGTAFLATKESNAPILHKTKLFSNEARYTTLTRLFSGRLARGIQNVITKQVVGKEQLIAPYPMQGKFMGPLRAECLKRGYFDYLMCWSGQSASLLKYRDCTTLLNALVEETTQLYER